MVSMEIWLCKSYKVFFFRIVLAILVPLPGHTDFRKKLSSSNKKNQYIKTVAVLIGITLYMSLGRKAILTILSFSIQEYDIYCSVNLGLI